MHADVADWSKQIPINTKTLGMQMLMMHGYYIVRLTTTRVSSTYSASSLVVPFLTNDDVFSCRAGTKTHVHWIFCMHVYTIFLTVYINFHSSLLLLGGVTCRQMGVFTCMKYKKC